jgi:hypothetical protein
MVIPSTCSHDQTFIITNWRAETNVAPDDDRIAKQWHSWTTSTIVTLVIGTSPLIDASLADLLGGRHERLGAPPDADMVDELAKELAGGNRELWDDLSESGRDQYRSGARISMKVLHKRYWIVPVRQNLAVQILADRDATGALIEVMRTDIAPQSLVWIHLEGMLRRDAA